MLNQPWSAKNIIWKNYDEQRWLIKGGVTRPRRNILTAGLSRLRRWLNHEMLIQRRDLCNIFMWEAKEGGPTGLVAVEG
jgi:hypothetical protein